MYFCPMTFKKYTSVLLAFYLLVSTTGLAFNVHHCGDEIASVSTVFSIEEPWKEQLKKSKKHVVLSQRITIKVVVLMKSFKLI